MKPIVKGAREDGGLLVASRTAADSQNLDLGKGVLITCLLWPVSHDHELNGDKWDKRITEQDQGELNHDIDSFVRWSVPRQARYRHAVNG